jgi:hypothetical protein
MDVEISDNEVRLKRVDHVGILTVMIVMMIFITIFLTDLFKSYHMKIVYVQIVLPITSKS